MSRDDRLARPVESAAVAQTLGQQAIYQHPLAYLASDDPPDIWGLHPWAPTATNASYRDKPSLIVWHFQLAAG